MANKTRHLRHEADCERLLIEVVSRQEAGATQSGVFWAVLCFGERLVAALLILTLLPALVAVALVIWILGKRSPFVAHRRVGQNGRELWLLKYRTMWGGPIRSATRSWFVEAIQHAGELKIKHITDPRVTSRFAAFCRKYSIDELPQLWHVARGEMSLIGPRPLTPEEIATFYGSDAPRLLRMRPGLSGLWQVNGRSSLTLTERRKLDLYMIDHWSLQLYLQILQATIPCVLSGRNAW